MSTQNTFNQSSKLWSDSDDVFFRERQLQPLKQEPKRCVATCLAIITKQSPVSFAPGELNTQDPVSWSDMLLKYGMKLAYCPTDVRKLNFYMNELIGYDDLFLLGYYTPTDSCDILRDPNEEGWICGSHIVVLHRDKILDPSDNATHNVVEHKSKDRHTKRIFRVVPADFRRGL